ncbi:hypothetical protein HYFRA_00012921 [Hymenoscyphus fraxineus]|uniref:Uncharacterized protein n=1 Tax=Hymenoscyphus fraxineus TaxID=746836 RepID=A0A9N9PLW3_9HELO|nr:hypothetical protein HYFRA_00012921 [Hymenoscyphus fraxineus]
MLFPSIVSHPVLALLVLTRLTSAAPQQQQQQAALQNHPLQATPGPPNSIFQPKSWKTPSKPAHLLLFPDSTRKPAINAHRPTCNTTSTPSNALSLEPETCLSGTYYLWYNLLIDDYPVCKDGSQAVMMYYPRTKCMGDPSFKAARPRQDDDEGGKMCLSRFPSRFWSLVFRCGGGMDEEGAERYLDAVPPED